MREFTRDIGPLSLRADVAPSTLDEAKRTVDVIWTTGAPVLRGFFDQFWEELSLDPKHVRMDRLNGGGAPLLDAHNNYDLSGVIGVVESARLEKKRGVATVRFARAEDDPNADAIFRKVKDGIIRNVSVGYRVHKMEKTEDGEGKIPVYRAVDWTPFEISMVPIGADAAAGVRATAPEPNKCVFVTRQEQTMDEPDKTAHTPPPAQPESPAAAATRAATKARIDAAAERAAAEQAAAEKARAEERARAAEIRQIAKRSGVLGEDWAAELIAAGTSVQEARDAAFEAMAKIDGRYSGFVTPVTAGEDERTKFVRGASAWLIGQSGARFIIERARQKDPDHFKDVSFDPGEFRGMTLVDLARLCLERGRVNTRGMDRQRIVEMALQQRANYQTIGDFPTLLENVLNKTLLGAYATQENTWQRFCLSIDVADFRTAYRYRTGSLPGLDVVPEHGEYTNGIIPDGSKYPVATQRLGKIVGLSREAIVNDDMGALTQIAIGLGAAAMRSIETAVYDLITANTGLGPTQGDAQPFFHANRANVATGAALSEAGLDADRVTMRQQLDPNGLDYLDLQPAVLLVPDSLYAQARKINSSIYSTDSGATFQEPNIANGLLRDVVGSPRITGTRRYMFATTMDAIVVAFLNGQGRAPTVESMPGWRTDGVEWKVSLYAMAQMGDPKSAVTNAGS